MSKQIICIKWGQAYGADYVNRLYAMVARNITGDFRFFCFTDDPSGIRQEVFCKPLPGLAAEIPPYAAHIWGKTHRAPSFGIWGKVRLWNPDLHGVEGEVLFLDLDIVIVDNIDAFFDFNSRNKVVLAKSETKPFRNAGQSSVYRFRVGQLAPLYERFCKNPQSVVEKWKMEQDFLNDAAPNGVVYWPRSWVRNFRTSCIRLFPMNYFLKPRIPANASVIIFPGEPNPPDAVLGRWTAQDFSRPPFDHVMDGIRGKRREKLWAHLRHYVKPTGWIQEAWQDQPEADKRADKC